MKLRLTTLAAAVGMALAGPAAAETDLDKLRAEVEQLKQKVESAAEWKDPKTLVHMAGYADVGYVDAEGTPGSFLVGTFAPIFHYQFNNMVMLESEMELEVDENGNTEVGLEYLTVDFLFHNNAALVVGKFLSPLGQFRQNLHPSWINKMASAPVGFGHDEAAPNAEVGAQLRGGFGLGRTRANYAVYIANGPAVELDGTGTELEMVETPGLNADTDGKKVVGGRFGLLLPGPRLELGVSAATGEVGEITTPSSTVVRDYQVQGVDFTWRPGDFNVVGEYIRQEVGANAASTAPEEGVWDAWYLQVAYRFPATDWEVVARYGEYDTPGTEADREQLALGVNYVFASNFVAKVNFESNDNPNPGEEAGDRWYLQLAYGF